MKRHCCDYDRGCMAPDCDYDEACDCECSCSRCDPEEYERLCHNARVDGEVYLGDGEYLLPDGRTERRLVRGML